MIFTVVNQDPKNRRNLTELLLNTYPGCVVYELQKVADVAPCLREHAVDAVLWELAESESQDLRHLHSMRAQHEGTHFLICADDDTFLEEAMWNGASMYFIKPLLPQQIAAALGTLQKA